MNDHDLSLLTDEEREIANRFSNRNNLGDGVPNFLLRALIAARAENANCDKLADDFRSVVSELSAARAENKRLRDGLLVIANADFGKVLELVGAPFVSSGDKYKSAEDFETAGDYSTDARYIRPARERAISAAARALLQSEKGGE